MNTELAEQVGQRLRQQGHTIALAESCTGGLVGHLITSVPGSSDYFLGGIIAYANQVKSEQLKVPADVLQDHGAVSRQTAAAMANGVRQQLKADLALAVTGIAGPSGGSAEKPVGLTWIGFAGQDSTEERKYIFPGNRQQVKEQAAEQALRLLLAQIKGGDRE